MNHSANTNQTFDQYLKSHLSSADYDSLPTLFSSKNKCTRLLKKPGEMSGKQLVALRKLLPVEERPKLLLKIAQYTK